jgi:hypothetical protein
MPFSNAAIYYRTEATNSGATPDPSNLPTAQVIHFNSETLRLEAFQEVEKNNLVTVPAPNSAGTRRLNLDDNGSLPNVFTLTGVMGVGETTNIAKLKGFRNTLQRDVNPDRHVYGIFGINWPAVPALSVDPDATKGLSIDQLQWNWNAPSPVVKFTMIIKKHGDDI